MKIKMFLLFILFASFLTANAQVDRSKMPKAGPAPEIKLGEYSTATLNNGLKVIVVENHRVPEVSIKLLIDTDPVLEGKNAGYVQLTGDLLGTWTKNRTKDQINEEVDFIGASLNTSSSGVFASALSKYTEKIMDIVSDVVMNAVFKKEELEKARKRLLSSLAAGKDDPSTISTNVTNALVFGKNHPYGEQITEETVKNVKLQMCKDYYKTYFKPNVAYLAIVGDITPNRALKLAKKYFGNWQKGEVPKHHYKMPEPPIITKVAFVDRPNSVQSVVQISYPLNLKKNNPDVIPARILNYIVGGNFTSRINLNLREAHGYTYGAHSTIVSDPLVGKFSVSWEGRNSVTDSSIAQALKELKKLRRSGVKKEELESTKKYIVGSFARSLESPQTIANFVLNIERYNLPKDYYKNYLKNVDAVTIDEMNKIAKKYIKPDNAYIVVVGNADEVAKKLKKFSLAGKVDFYDVYGNKVNPGAKKLPKGLTAKTVIANYIKAIGGKENYEKIKDKTEIMKGNIRGMSFTFKIYQKAPNKLYQFMDAGAFQTKTIFDGKKAVTFAMGQKREIKGDKLNSLKLQADIHAILNYDKIGVKPELAGVEKVNGKEAYKMYLKMPWGDKYTQYFSVKTGLLVRQVVPITTPQGTFNQTTDLSDYKEVNGVKFPFKIKQQAGPQSIELTVEKILINSGVADSLFEIK